jgi:ubiquinone biosynthesis protein
VINLLPVPWFARPPLARRSRQIAVVLTRHGLSWLLAQVGLSGVPVGRRWSGRSTPRPAPTQPERLRMALAELGATFIKLGQAMSTRPDVIPPEYVAELTKLQDAAPPVPFELMRQVIEEELGEPPEEIFSEFDPQPLASASIGQVHAAVLKDGHKVIVKVQFPGVAEQVEQDLEILSGMVEWVLAHSALGRDYDLRGLVDEFAFTLRNELDYRQEGRNADQFRRFLADEPTIYIPRVYWRLTTGRVLTLERVGGVNISDLAGLDAAGIDRRVVAENSIHFVLREVFEFGLIHADPHPGNCFVRTDGSIVLIDFGMVGRLEAGLRDALLRVGMAVVRHDAEQLADEFYALGVAGGHSKRSALQRDLDHFLGRYATGSMKEIAAAQVAADFMAIAFRHRLQLPSELALLFKVVIVSEWQGTCLDPDFKLLEYAAPYLKQVWIQQRSPQVMAVKFGQAALDAAELSVQLPRRAARLLAQLERGDLDLKVNLDSLRDIILQMQRMANRLALAIILGATIVSLGLILSVYHVPGWDAYGGWLFGMGFVFSLAFGVWLTLSILRAGRG